MSGFNGNPRAGADIPIEPAYDVVVVGGGAAGLTAAACAAVDGLNVLLVDKAERIGGTTAISGGMVWAPANRFAEEAGMRDSLEAATRYLHATVPDGADDPLLATFVHSAGPAIDFLRAHIGLELQPVLRYPDYYQAAAGATLGACARSPAIRHQAARPPSRSSCPSITGDDSLRRHDGRPRRPSCLP